MQRTGDFYLLSLLTKSGGQIRVYDSRLHAGTPLDVGDAECSYENALTLLHASGVHSFSACIRGDCMVDAGIFDGDTVVLEAGVEPQNGCIVAASVDGEPVLRYFYRDERQKDVVWLVPANFKKGYTSMRVDATTELRVLGVVVSAVKNFSRREFGIVSKLKSKVENERVARLDEVLSCEATPRFESCIIDPRNKTAIMQQLHQLIDGHRGKDVAKVVRAAMTAALISRPTFSQMVQEFGDIGNRAGFHRYMAYEFFDHELQPLVQRLESALSQA